MQSGCFVQSGTHRCLWLLYDRHFWQRVQRPIAGFSSPRCLLRTWQAAANVTTADGRAHNVPRFFAALKRYGLHMLAALHKMHDNGGGVYKHAPSYGITSGCVSACASLVEQDSVELLLLACHHCLEGLCWHAWHMPA